MSDEKNKEKKQEEQASRRPWLFRQLDAIKETIESTDDVATLKRLFDNVFKEMTNDNLWLMDEEGVRYRKYLQQRGGRIEDEGPGFGKLHVLYKLTEPIVLFWTSWFQARQAKKGKDLNALDYFMFFFFGEIDIDSLRFLHNEIYYTDFSFSKLIDSVKKEHYYNSNTLEAVGGILEKLWGVNHFHALEGRNFCARAQALRVKDELKLEETKQELAQLKKDTEEQTEKLQKGIEESRENEQRMTRNFVQIIGIFAAIIAFIVTMVPTAARLGGASIPIALAGLAIVTAGIVILLAMIFGKDERRKSLSKGLTGIIIAFTLWLTLTVVLAFVEPNVLRPPPDPVRVDTLYIDTVETTPPPTPSIKEGD